MKGIRLYIFLGSALLALYFVAQYNRPKAIDWSETLINDDKAPFGTYVLFHRLTDIFPAAKVVAYREPIYNVINDHHLKRGTYIIICNKINLNDNDYERLTQFIKSGNDVFISASYFGDELSKKLKVETESEFNSAKIKLLNPSLDSAHYYNPDRNISSTYFSKLDTEKVNILGKNNFGHSNFIKYLIGKGNLYLNANPLMFSNYSILNGEEAAYASTVLSYLKNDKILLWDEYYTQGRDGGDNTMRVFYKYASLRWAFYIAVFGLLIFVLYEMKRRQRVIPIIEPLKNSTVEFANVVGQVYYEQRNNMNIAQKMIIFFYEHLRTKYYLKTNPLDAEFIERLSQKTGIELPFAQELIGHIKYVLVQHQVSDHELIRLNQLIEQFYKKTR